MSIKNIKKLKVPLIKEKNGNLAFVEFRKEKKFNIKRVFFVTTGKSSIRGKHAHKKISQIIICLAGKIEIECDDGINKKKFVLNKITEGLVIPNMIWSVLNYKSKNSTIAVLCDGYFDEKEYIRNYDKFKKACLKIHKKYS